jgi:hypothetical protein
LLSYSTFNLHRIYATGTLVGCGSASLPTMVRIGRVPRTLWATGDRLENRFGKFGRDYKKITFDKNILIEHYQLKAEDFLKGII